LISTQQVPSASGWASQAYTRPRSTTLIGISGS
jgi:hypothetical protein